MHFRKLWDLSSNCFVHAEEGGGGKLEFLTRMLSAPVLTQLPHTTPRRLTLEHDHPSLINGCRREQNADTQVGCGC